MYLLSAVETSFAAAILMCIYRHIYNYLVARPEAKVRLQAEPLVLESSINDKEWVVHYGDERRSASER